MAGFDNPWYAEMIERFSPDAEDENGNCGRAILAGFCILAGAIDGLASAIDGLGSEYGLSKDDRFPPAPRLPDNGGTD